MNVFAVALRSVFRSTGYRIVGIASFVVFFAANVVALPGSAGGGRIAGAVSGHTDFAIVGESLLAAALLGILAPFSIYLVRQRARAHLAASSAGVLLCTGFCLMGPLCCGALYVALGWLIGLAPALAGYASPLYAFLNDQGAFQTLFFLVSMALLGYALYRNSRKIAALSACSG